MEEATGATLPREQPLRATVTDRNETVISDERPIRIEWGPGGCG